MGASFSACGGGVVVTPEALCDGIDDDDDRRIDEGFGVGESCSGTGECGEGVVECASLETWRCSTDPGGSADESETERCDDLDHDCDGDTANGIGDMCQGEGACGIGVLECGAAPDRIITCSTNPGGSADASGVQICNGMDGDCDGEIDEGLMIGRTCTGTGACGAGVFECRSSGDAVCSTDPGGTSDESAVETCDGTDEDCDGMIDEDFMVGEPCDGSGSCGMGMVECATVSETRCSTDPGGSMEMGSVEVCDDVDNDCDGDVDEGFGTGAPCTGPGACGEGLTECADEFGLRCSTDPGGSNFDPQPETCDGADNDCDETVDEGTITELCGTTGECISGSCGCSPGTFDIDPGTPGCECISAPAIDEGVSCAAAIDLGNLSDAGQTMTVMGNAMPSDRAVWYQFRAVDTPDTTCDNFHVRAELTTNPDDAFELTMFRGSCTTPVNADMGYTDQTWRLDFRATIGGVLSGHCPCQSGVASTNVSQCVDDSANFFVRVRRRAAVDSCANYAVEFSNGIYDTP